MISFKTRNRTNSFQRPQHATPANLESRKPQVANTARTHLLKSVDHCLLIQKKNNRSRSLSHPFAFYSKPTEQYPAPTVRSRVVNPQQPAPSGRLAFHQFESVFPELQAAINQSKPPRSIKACKASQRHTPFATVKDHIGSSMLCC